jgi:hypothetical protein
MGNVHSTEFLRDIPEGRVPSSSRGFRPWLVVVAVAWVLVAVPCVRAQSSKPTDYDVKAAYLYNFGHFVEWPANVASAQNEPFTVCVLGQDPFGPVLDTTLAGETIAGKRVAAKRISTLDEAGSCQILFLSSAEEARLNSIIKALSKQAVLTVSDMPEFAKRGGMLQFVLEGKRVRFEVNLAAVQHAGLSLSSELLKVATTVRRNSSPGD